MREAFKTILISVLIGVQVMPLAARAADPAPECRSDLMDLGREAAARLIQLQEGPMASDDAARSEASQKIQAEFTKALAGFQEKEIARKYFDQIQDLQKDIADLEKCGGASDCVLQKARLTSVKLKRAVDTIYSSWAAEPRAKKILRAQIESLVGAMADETIAKSMGSDELVDRIASDLKARPQNDGGFIKRLGERWWQTLLAFKMKNIRTRPEVRRDLLRNLAVTLTNQSITMVLDSFGPAARVLHHVGLAATNDPVPLATNAWVPPSTVTMITIQSEIGGAKTDFIDSPFSDYEGAVEALPKFINGTNGFVTDFKDKFRSFFFIAYLEFPIMLFFRTAATLALNHGQGLSHLPALMISTLFTLPGIYTYLSTKWAVFDKPLLLNFFPNYLNGTRSDFEKSLYQTLQTNNAIPSGLTLSEFTGNLRHDYSAYESYFKDADSKNFSPELATAYNKMKGVTRRELVLRAANGLWDSMVIFMIINAANSAYMGSLDVIHAIIK